MLCNLVLNYFKQKYDLRIKLNEPIFEWQNLQTSLQKTKLKSPFGHKKYFKLLDTSMEWIFKFSATRV